MKRSQVPAFGSWDCNDEDLQFTQCFETARPTGLFRYSYSGDRDFYVTPHLYPNHFLTPAMIVVPRGKANADAKKHVKQEKKERYRVCDYDVKVATSAPQNHPPTQKKLPTVPKAVDEDLYKISPDLLYAQTKKKRVFGLFSCCLLPTCSY